LLRAMRGQGASWLLIGGIVVLNTVAQTFFKLGAGRGLVNGWIAVGLAAYGVSTVLYVGVLGRLSLSFAYPVVIGATVMATCIAGARVMGERLVGAQWLGIALVITGIAFIARSLG
jgi:multidrug transporter EmrE-like cation transporter